MARSRSPRAHNSTLPRPSKPMARGGPIARTTRVKPRNARRRAREFARCYHSVERVAWIKAQPCAWCLHRGKVRIPRPSENAHTVTGGMGRKAGYATIVPLCANHHTRYDEHRAPFDSPPARLAVTMLAAATERRWQAYQGALPGEHQSNG